MSIADKLTYLNETKSLLREAINAAGGNLTQETPFREYAEGWLRDQSASLSLDFSKQQYVAKDKVSMFPDRVGFEDIVTFTRSTGGGRFNAQGQYEWVGPDEPRIDYDPVTGECLGLLVEEQRTNLLSRSAPSTWAKSSGTTLEATFTRHGMIFGQLGVSGMYQAVSMAGATVGSAVTVAAGSVTKSFYLIPGSLTTIWDRTPSVAGGALIVRIDIVSGVPVYSGVSGSTTGWAHTGTIITKIENDLYKIEIAYTCQETSTASGAITLTLGEAGPFTNGVALGGVQLEQGSFPTSYIPTEGAQVTRAADIATVNDLAPWYNPNQGSFSIKAKGHIGEPLLAAGDALIIADSDELKEYQVSYSEDLQATQVDMGKGLIESIRYWPRETA